MSPVELAVGEVLDYYDGPILFTATDATGASYLCVFLENDRDHDRTRFLCARPAPERTAAFLAGTVDLRTVVQEQDVPLFLLETVDKPTPLIAVPVTQDEILPTLLPSPGYYHTPTR